MLQQKSRANAQAAIRIFDITRSLGCVLRLVDRAGLVLLVVA